MKIVCVGGGPGGLYFAISAKIRDPRHEIHVYERNRAGDTFGWGVVFSDQTLGRLEANDKSSAEAIFGAFQHWDDIDVFYGGTCIRSGGHGFAGLSRRKMLLLLQDRARALGVHLHFECDIDDVETLRDCDLLIASDGVNSRIRTTHQQHFLPDIDFRPNKFVWLGTHRIFDAFTFIFERTEHGWFQTHAYRFDDETSTFIVECTGETWERHGLSNLSKDASNAFCESIFKDYLNGESLVDNAAHLKNAWLNFPRVSNEHWFHENIVLLGDAAHTAHFSIGSGTKLALEDAIELAEQISTHASLPKALSAYESARKLEVVRLQSAARNSTEWFENVSRYANLEPPQFTYSLLTRSQRVSHENLKKRDANWMKEFEEWFAQKAVAKSDASPLSDETDDRSRPAPMFTPFRLRDLTLSNRVAVSPMCMYSASDGEPNDFHLVHLGSRALGGAALIFTEMTNVSREGRISPGCTGMYKPEHLVAWKRIVNFIQGETNAKLALQLGHSGPKGATKLAWQGIDEPLNEGAWQVVGPSETPYSPSHQTPRALNRKDMDEIRAQFEAATHMAVEAGFDMLELHAAHGYLLSAFITPLLNHRSDDYGGSLSNRLKYPVEVFRACRSIWPESKPMSVRISATDWVEGGITGEDAVAIARGFKDAGADIIHVSSGQTSPAAKPVYGRMYQTPYADRIRNEVDIPTIAVGNIFTSDHVNSIVAAGRADVCCLARPHLANPNWTLHAAAEQGFDAEWPKQYEAGRDQWRRNLTGPVTMPLDI